MLDTQSFFIKKPRIQTIPGKSQFHLPLTYSWDQPPNPESTNTEFLYNLLVFLSAQNEFLFENKDRQKVAEKPVYFYRKPPENFQKIQ